MSTYITAVETPVLNAWMRARDIIVLDFFEILPEQCFVREHLTLAMTALAAGEPDRKIKLKNFWWLGTRSRDTYEDVLLKKVAPYVMGKVEAIFTWEEGAWQTGLIIEDGNVSECDVKCEILKPKAKKSKSTR